MDFRIVHIAQDSVFLPVSQQLYEIAFPNANEFFIVDKHKTLKHGVNLSITESVPQLDVQHVLRSNPSVVVFHSANQKFETVLPHIPEPTLVVWHTWGYDYVKLISPFRPAILDPLTRIVYRSLFALRSTLYLMSLYKAKGVLADIHDRIQYRYRDSSYRRFDVVSIQEELYPALQEAIPGFNAIRHTLPIYTCEDHFEYAGTIDGENILLGNSASPSNNHLELLFQLKRIGIGDRKLIIPLSYGSRMYAKLIAAVGKRLFGKQCIPLLTFMPLHDYQKLIQSCRIVIMNHTRQQARGNITSAIYNGASVFLREENPIFMQYQKEGMILYPMSSLPNRMRIKINKEEQEKNRSLVRQRFSRDAAIASILSLQDLYEQKITHARKG